MLFIILGLIVVDQLSKYYIQSTMQTGMSIAVVSDVFHITYILNPGAAFGILENQHWFFILVALCMIGAAVYYYPRLKREHLLIRLGASLLVGGAAGNLIDRVKTGYVVDFLDFRIWPIFNIADIGIVAGVALIIYALFFVMDKRNEINE